MQSAFGSTEAINVNGTEISPLTTWDSKITTVLAMLGGVGPVVERGLRAERDHSADQSAFDRFVSVANREHALVFGRLEDVKGDEFDFMVPNVAIPTDKLSDWDLSC